MEPTNPINVHDESADTYDASVEEYHSHLHELLFGMCYEYVRPGHRLLDIGIGTGLSSLNFARAGADVYGMDPSSNMIEQCRKKGFATDLKQHSLTDPPLPYQDKAFAHVIACGVFHFFGRLDGFFDEACRVLQEDGIFALTVATPEPGEQQSDGGAWVEEQTPWGLSLYKHGDDYVERQLRRCALEPLKYQRILQQGGAGKDVVFKVVVCRKVSGYAT